MNYTGLGVGNRNGVYVQLFGCCLAVIGMIHAFYLRPILKRRMAAGAPTRADAAEFPAMPPLTERVSRGEPLRV
jgi:hypothetical protein